VKGLSQKGSPLTLVEFSQGFGLIESPSALLMDRNVASAIRQYSAMHFKSAVHQDSPPYLILTPVSALPLRTNCP
jgi:hypothetical protein